MHLRPIEHVNGINLFEGTNYFKIVMNWKVKRGSLRGKSTVLFTHFWHIRLQDKCSDCTYPWWTLACRPESHARVHFPVKQQDHVPLKKTMKNFDAVAVSPNIIKHWQTESSKPFSPLKMSLTVSYSTSFESGEVHTGVPQTHLFTRDMLRWLTAADEE